MLEPRGEPKELKEKLSKGRNCSNNREENSKKKKKIKRKKKKKERSRSVVPKQEYDGNVWY